MGNNTRITYQTYMEYSTHVNKYSIMNIGKHINKYKSILSSTTITETSKAVGTNTWSSIRDTIPLHIIQLFQQYNNIL